MYDYKSLDWLDRSLDVHDLQVHRLAHRRLLEHLFRRYLAHALGPSRISINGEGCVCLVGSVARGEFDIENSDVDIWFLGIDPATRNEILKAFSQEFKAVDIGLSSDDLGLIERNEGKVLDKNWKKYPCLDEDDFATSGVRRAQVLFETVSVHNDERYLHLQKIALGYAGIDIRGRDVRQKTGKIYQDIAEYSCAVTESKVNNAVEFAKQLVSRRLGQHLMRLSVLEAVFRKKAVTESQDPGRKFIEILQTPTASKALFWASNEFFRGTMMSRIAGPEFRGIYRDMIKLTENYGFKFPSTGDPRWIVGRLAILATREYSSALNLLHSSSLRKVLNEIKDFALPHHAEDPNVDQLITTARRFVRTCVALVQALELIFQRYDEARLFSRPYQNSGLETAVKETLKGLLNDPLAKNN